MDVETVLAAVIALVETAQAKVLQPLKDRRQAVEQEAKHLTDELQAEINRFEKTISELDDISALEDHILFLQVRGKHFLQVLHNCSAIKSLFESFHSPPLHLRVTHLFHTRTTSKTGST